MAGGGGGVIHIPWYATLFRGDKFAIALKEISPVALRYGATEHLVYRGRDDTYRFLQVATFPDHESFERYWYGEEFIGWREDYSSWYQVPVLYAWNDLIIAGEIDGEDRELTGAPAEGDTIG